MKHNCRRCNNYAVHCTCMFKQQLRTDGTTANNRHRLIMVFKEIGAVPSILMPFCCTLVPSYHYYMAFCLTCVPLCWWPTPCLELVSKRASNSATSSAGVRISPAANHMEWVVFLTEWTLVMLTHCYLLRAQVLKMKDARNHACQPTFVIAGGQHQSLF